MDAEIDHDSIEPVYVQLARILRARIAAGEPAPGHRLPSETELVQAYAVARLTARRACRELARLGLVETQQGRGSFVIGDEGLLAARLELAAREDEDEPEPAAASEDPPQ